MPQRMARPNIKEVASVAGLSTQSISRVINKRPDVSPKTRKRVQPMIEALGYKPGDRASGWISQRSYTLGIIAPGLDLEYMRPSRLSKDLPPSNKYNIRPVFQVLLSRQVDGIMALQKNISAAAIYNYQGGNWQ
jgi:hypothetical protein